MVEINTGDILIDELSIRHIPRATIRERLIALPQDPLTIAGTVRENADPFSQHTDEDILSAMQEVGMLAVTNAKGGLDTDMDEMKLSCGELQLFCLVRVLLSSSRIVVIDEMTSSLDVFTEAKIVEIMSRKLADRTILVIAHHLQTIRDFDLILVLDEGRIAEVGRPDDLLQRDTGFFLDLWNSHPTEG